MSGTGIDAWRRTILERMKAVLKPLGFRKHGTTFNRFHQGVWQVVNLQSSQWNEQNRLGVYLNIGLFYGEDGGLYGQDPMAFNPKTGPTEPLCHWRKRVKEGSQGQMWEVASSEEAEKFGDEIANLGKTLVLEAAETYPSPTCVLDDLRENTAGVTKRLDGVAMRLRDLRSLAGISDS